MDTRVTRLRAWSGITGWRFESSSAHLRKPCVRGAFVVLGRSGFEGATFSRQRLVATGPHLCGPPCGPLEAAVSVDVDPSKSRWRVRWRENGKQRSRRFASEAEAVAFDEARTLPQPTTAAAPLRTRAEGDAIYAYATKAGRRYRSYSDLGRQTRSTTTRQQFRICARQAIHDEDPCRWHHRGCSSRGPTSQSPAEHKNRATRTRSRPAADTSRLATPSVAPIQPSTPTRSRETG
jgi:hypothetical protein